MKKISKKLLLVLIACAFVLGACGSKGAASNEKPTLIFYNVGTPSKDNEKVNEALNAKLDEKNVGYNVQVNYVDWGEYEQKLQILNNAGEKYDIAFTATWAGPYLALASKGAFYDVEELVKEVAPETLKQLGGKDTLDAVRVKGKVYAIPSALKAINLEIMFSKELVEKYNIPYQDIHSFKDLEPWYDKISQAEPGYDMLQIGQDFSLPNPYDEILWPLGVGFTDEAMEVVNIFETEPVMSNLSYLRKFYEKKYINQDAAITKDARKDKPFFTNIADGGPGSDAIWSRLYKQDIVSTPIVEHPYASTNATEGSMLAISAASEHPKEAVEFIELMNTDQEVQDILSYGIEGVHFNYDEHHRIVETDKMDDYRGVPQFTLGTGQIRSLTSLDDLGLRDEEKAYQKSLNKSVILGFSFDASNVQTEVANMQNVKDEFKSAIATGSVDPNEYVKKMNEKLEAAGIEKVKEEIKLQIEAWKKEQA